MERSGIRGTDRPDVKAAGFTLLELLLVTALIAVVLAAVGACLASGIRVWEVAQRFGQSDVDAALGLELLERDLANALPFPGIGFDGKTATISFAGESAFGDAGVCRVRYRLSGQGSRLERSASRYPVSPDPSSDKWEPVSRGISAIAFRYQASAAGTEGAWIDQWQSATGVPRAVEITLAAGDGDVIERFTRRVVVRMQ